IMICARRAKGKAAAAAAAIESQYKPRHFRRATMDEGMYAQRAVDAMHDRCPALQMRKAGIPHQRAIAEYPEILHVSQLWPCSFPWSGKARRPRHGRNWARRLPGRFRR